mmetsp:Transcript_8601/g.31749  ORF Transcript_8601/g.31749 Transcript_8601/m.31749 type:complete len:808 (+) Transcript_8601:513-2936(+)
MSPHNETASTSAERTGGADDVSAALGGAILGGRSVQEALLRSLAPATVLRQIDEAAQLRAEVARLRLQHEDWERERQLLAPPASSALPPSDSSSLPGAAVLDCLCWRHGGMGPSGRPAVGMGRHRARRARSPLQRLFWLIFLTTLFVSGVNWRLRARHQRALLAEPMYRELGGSFTHSDPLTELQVLIESQSGSEWKGVFGGMFTYGVGSNGEDAELGRAADGEATTSPRQGSTSKDSGHRVPRCDRATLLTAVAMGQGDLVAAMATELHRFLSPTSAPPLCVRLLVYDLGLTQRERAELQTTLLLYTETEKCPKLEKGVIRTFAFDAYPPHVSSDNTFAWKALMIQTVLDETPTNTDLIFSDPGMLLPEQLEEIHRQLDTIGLVVNTTDLPVAAGVSPDSELLQLFTHSNTDALLRRKMISSEIIAISGRWGKAAATRFMPFWVDCALHRECMGSVGGNLVNRHLNEASLSMSVYAANQDFARLSTAGAGRRAEALRAGHTRTNLNYVFPRSSSFSKDTRSLWIRNYRKAFAGMGSDVSAIRVQLSGATGHLAQYNGQFATVHIHSSMPITPVEVLVELEGTREQLMWSANATIPWIREGPGKKPAHETKSPPQAKLLEKGKEKAHVFVEDPIDQDDGGTVIIVRPNHDRPGDRDERDSIVHTSDLAVVAKADKPMTKLDALEACSQGEKAAVRGCMQKFRESTAEQDATSAAKALQKGSSEDGECVNKNSDCVQWGFLGYCETNKIWMATNCKPACGLCERTDCKDYHLSCAQWTSVGECKRNPLFMLDQCRVSCNVCAPRTHSY